MYSNFVAVLSAINSCVGQFRSNKDVVVSSQTLLSQRVGRGVPGVLVWSLCYFMIHGMGGLGEVANGLMAASCGAYIC